MKARKAKAPAKRRLNRYFRVRHYVLDRKNRTKVMADCAWACDAALIVKLLNEAERATQ